MNPTIPSRIGQKLGSPWAMALAVVVGCDSTPRFDPAVQYSADTLAQEFAPTDTAS